MRANRLTAVQSLGWLVPAVYAALVYVAVVGGVGVLVPLGPSGQAMIALSFVAAAISVAGFPAVHRRADRLMRRNQPRTPYDALTAAPGALSPVAGSWEQTLPALARVLAEGTGASHASLWLRTDGQLVNAASWPVMPAGAPHSVDDLDALRAVPGIDHVVPIFDHDLQRGALAVAKPGTSTVTEDDARIMGDIASGAGLLLRAVALNAELEARVRQAEELGDELGASRHRLMHARDVERRRLVTEINTVTVAGLTDIRAELENLKNVIEEDRASAERLLDRLRSRLDEVIERFRAVVRGVYPGVLRDEGPRAALEEMASALPRPVHLTAKLDGRVDWEIESSLYYVSASTMRLLGQDPAQSPLRIHLAHDSGRVVTKIEDPGEAPPSSEELRADLADDEDRLAALGGGLRCEKTPSGLVVTAWLPDQLEPEVAERAQADTAAPAEPADGPEPAQEQEEGAGQLTATPSMPSRTRRIARAAADHYSRSASGEMLSDIADRLEEPPRVAILGGSKVGKSTLVNALAGGLPRTERHRTTTWYRYGPQLETTLHPKAGRPRKLPADTTLDAEDLPPEEVDHVVVEFPSTALRGMTLIDLPGNDAEGGGIERVHALRRPAEDGIATVDVLVYVRPDLHVYDPGFWESVAHEPGRRAPATVVVLSHADEVDDSRLDALDAAQRITEEYERDPQVRRACQAVVPVAGLLATADTTLGEPDFWALRQLADLPQQEADHLLRSSDRFARIEQPPTPGPAQRAALLDKLGLFGIRLAVELLRADEVNGVGELSLALVHRSGIEQLRELLTSRYAGRADVLKAWSGLLGLDAVLSGITEDEAYRDSLRYELDQVRSRAHELVEIDLLDDLRDATTVLSPEDRALAERLLGAAGPDPCSRLALPRGAGADEIQQAAARQLAQWQLRAENPASTRELRKTCLAVVRTCEGLLGSITTG